MDPGIRSTDQTDQPEFRPPGQLPGQDPGNGPAMRVVWWLLAAIAGVGLLVIFVLPGVVNKPPEPGMESSLPETPADSSTARTDAEQALQSYLELRARLELDNVTAWGEPEWGRSTAAADSGDRQFSQRRFGPAASAYHDALQDLQALIDGREQRLTTALAEGQQALAADDSTTAIARFELALAITPDNTTALQGLARAKVRPDIVQLMATGAQAESAGDLVAAKAGYLQAVTLDGEYQPAEAALARVDGQLDDIAWRDAMTRALAALDVGRLTTARKALNEAEQLRPDDSAVRDARRRLAATSRQSQLKNLRHKAAARVAAEDWQGAVSLYKQALRIDANVGFASEGLAQAQRRVSLHEQIDHYLEQPARLYSAEPLVNAGELIKTAATAPADEPKLAGKIARLRKLVNEAQTPLAVSLRSDGETRVVIYHIGDLGQFESRQMQLRPGDYTVVGSRPGYRDVRKLLNVRPGRPVATLMIRCEEPV